MPSGALFIYIERSAFIAIDKGENKSIFIYHPKMEDHSMKKSARQMNDTEQDEDLYCPRCQGDDLIDFGESFQCVSCDLEFDKEDLDEFDDDDILSIDEKLALRPKFWLTWL